MTDKNEKRRNFAKLTLVALGGITAGVAFTGCSDQSPISSTTAASTTTSLATTPAADLHACKGLNGCKSEGAGSLNSCAGQGGCASTAAHHECKGHNACKGQGGGEMAGMNACKGQGGCAVPIKDEMVWKKAARLSNPKCRRRESRLASPRPKAHDIATKT